jgi:dTDP-4-dehydrorhamnose reductase
MTTHDFSWQDLDVNITDAKAVRAALDTTPAKVVVNFAAFTNVGEAWKQRGDLQGTCYRVNVTGAQNLARACAERGKYLVHVSTDYVYPGDRQTPYQEEYPTRPVEWYGQTKAWGEAEVLTHHPDAAVFRIAAPFRADPHQKEDIVRKLVRQLREGTLPPMFSDTVVTPTFIDDFARAVARAVVIRPDGVYNVVGGTALSPARLAEEVAQAYGLDAGAIRTGSLADYLAGSDRPYAQFLNLSNQKAEQKLGITFSTLRAALSEIKCQQET